jgi:hypothetical protein
MDLTILNHYSRLQAAPTILIIVAGNAWERLPAAKVIEDRFSAKTIGLRNANEIKKLSHISTVNY